MDSWTMMWSPLMSLMVVSGWPLDGADQLGVDDEVLSVESGDLDHGGWFMASGCVAYRMMGEEFVEELVAGGDDA
nr:hypothetical protein [Mucisphaera calidilacus]